MKYDNLIIVSRSFQLPLALKVCNQLSSEGGNPLIITIFPAESIGASVRNKYAFRDFRFYHRLMQQKYDDFRQQAIDLIHNLAGIEFEGSANLRDMTSFKGVPLWDLCSDHLQSALIPLIYRQYLANLILGCELPKSVYVAGGETEQEKIFESLCVKKGVNFTKFSNDRKPCFAQTAERCLLFLRRIKRFLASLYYFSLNRSKFKKLIGSGGVMFCVPLKRYLNSMLPVIKKYNERQRIVVNMHAYGSDKILKKNKIIFTNFYGCKIYNPYPAGYFPFLNRIESVFSIEGFLNEKLFSDLPCPIQLLREILKKLIREVFPEMMREVEILNKIMAAFRPKAVVICNYYPLIALTAKGFSVPVVAIQNIHTDDFSKYGRIIADAILVNGNYWKGRLLKFFPYPEKIWITGLTRFEGCQENNFSQSLRYPRNKKLVVFATGHDLFPAPLEIMREEKQEQINAVFQAVRKMDDVYLVVKLHPFEKDYASYRRSAVEAQLSEFALIRDIEMVDLLSRSDLVITYLSAAGYEAILLNKNVIFLEESSKFMGQDCWNLKSYGTAFSVKNLSDLEGYIRMALYDKEAQLNLRKNREDYIHEHAYKLDGNASLRAKDVIERLSQGQISRVGKND